MVCSAPLNQFDGWITLIYGIELYKKYGADLYAAYLNSAHSGVFHLLRDYETRGDVKIFKWTTPPR